MILSLILVGLVSILGQVVLLRELSVAFYGSELIYILAFGVWLFWTGLGAAAGRRETVPGSHGIRILFLIFSLLLPLDLAFIRGVRTLFGGVPGAYLPFPHQMISMVLALAPVGLLLGLLFQWTAKRYVAEDRTLARAYAIESLGGLLGGLLATFCLVWGLQNLTLALLCILLSLRGVHLKHGRSESRHSHPVFRAAVAALTLLALVGVWRNDELDLWMTRWNHPHLTATRDTPYGRVSVTESSGLVSVFENDVLAYESEGTAAEEFVHFAALQHSDPDKVLILGGAVEGLATEALKHSPVKVDMVELNGPALQLSRSFLPGTTRDAFKDPRIHMEIADPRRRLLIAGEYDLLLVGMPEPASAQANRFYTEEFFDLCASNLRPSGILAFRLPSSENLWTLHLLRRAASINEALKNSFSHRMLVPGTTNIFLASRSPLIDESSVLAKRLKERGLHPRLVSAPYLRYLLTNDRFDEFRSKVESTPAPANTDAQPICYQYTLMIWLSRFFPDLTLSDLSYPGYLGREGPNLAWFFLLLPATVFLLVRRLPMIRRGFLVALAGFAGMILESLLILNYQMKSGVLYQDIGLLLTLFMAGLALGAFLFDRIYGMAPIRRLRRLPGPILISVFFGFCLLLSKLIREGSVGELGTTGILLLLTGLLVAALFAYASLHGFPDQKAAVSRLYSADLLGGCLGSLAGSFFLIPAVGIADTAVVMASLLAAGLALI